MYTSVIHILVSLVIISSVYITIHSRLLPQKGKDPPANPGWAVQPSILTETLAEAVSLSRARAAPIAESCACVSANRIPASSAWRASSASCSPDSAENRRDSLRAAFSCFVCAFFSDENASAQGQYKKVRVIDENKSVYKKQCYL